MSSFMGAKTRAVQAATGTAPTNGDARGAVGLPVAQPLANAVGDRTNVVPLEQRRPRTLAGGDLAAAKLG